MQCMLLSGWSPGGSPVHEDGWLSPQLIKIPHFPHHTGTFSSRGQARSGGHDRSLLRRYFLFHHGIFQRGKGRVKIDLSLPWKRVFASFCPCSKCLMLYLISLSVPELSLLPPELPTDNLPLSWLHFWSLFLPPFPSWRQKNLCPLNPAISCKDYLNTENGHPWNGLFRSSVLWFIDKCAAEFQLK